MPCEGEKRIVQSQQGDAIDWVTQIPVWESETTEHSLPCIYRDMRYLDLRPPLFSQVFTIEHLPLFGQ